MRLQFFVSGEPIPEGSTKAFSRGGKVVVTHDNPRLDAWRKVVALSAITAAQVQGWPHRFDGPVMVVARFWLPRPKTVKRAVPSVKPDTDKLIRAVGDALCPRHGPGVLAEDSRIITWSATKAYADDIDPVGARVTVTSLEVPF